MGCVQSYFRKAHSAGISPSSTQGSENAGLITDSPTDPKKQLLTDDVTSLVNHVITTPPETILTPIATENGIHDDHPPGTNGSSKTGMGLGPGIAALAASTGTVAILGAAADTTKDALEDVEKLGEDVKKEAESLTQNLEQVAEEATHLGEDVKSEVDSIVVEAAKAGNDAFQEGQDAVVTGLESVTQKVEDVAEEAVKLKDEVQKNAENALEEAEEAAGDVIQEGSSLVESGVEAITEKVENAREEAAQIGEDVTKEVANVVDEVEKAGSDAIAEGEHLIQKGVDSLTNKVDEVTEDAAQLKESVKAEVESTLEKVEKTGSDVIQDGTNLIESGVEAITEKVEDVREEAAQIGVNVTKEVKIVVEEVEKAGSDAIENSENLIQKGVDSLTEKVDEVTEEAVELKENAQTEVANALEDIEEAGDSAVQKGTDLVDTGVEALAEKVDDSREEAAQLGEEVKKEAEILVEKVTEDAAKEVENMHKDAQAVTAQIQRGVQDASKGVETLTEEVVKLADDATPDIVKQLSKDVEVNSSTPEPDNTNNKPTIVEEEAIQKVVSRPTSGITQAFTHIEDDDEYPAPPPPESEDFETCAVIEEAPKITCDNVESEADVETHARVRRSITEDTPESNISTADAVRPDSKTGTERATSTNETKEVIEVIDPQETSEGNKFEHAATELVTSAATTIQATFRGHQTRQTLRDIADQEITESEVQKDNVESSEEVIKEDKDQASSATFDDEFPPPLNDTESDLAESITTEKESSGGQGSTTDIQSVSSEREDKPPVINVTIHGDPVDSQPESLGESDKVSEEKSTVPAESDPESLDALVDDVNRAESNVSESTVSIGDSVNALKGSETDSVNAFSVSEDQKSIDGDEKLSTAATTIQASFRGFQTRQNLQKIADDTQLPLPEPIPDFLCEDPADEDDLPPPPEECDIEPPVDVPEQEEEIASVPSTPRSPETGEKVKPTHEGDEPNQPSPSEDVEADKLALLQKPQECDELPEQRGVSVDDDDDKGSFISVTEEDVQKIDEDIAALQAAKENGVVAYTSSAEVDDSSLSSAATKIQAGARGYLTRKLMKDTFSTTAPSITDSQQSGGAGLTSQEEDDGVHTSGSLETEVQRQSIEDNVGVTAVIIAKPNETIMETLENGIVGTADEISLAKGLSLDSQLPQEKKAGLVTAATVNVAESGSQDDQQVWNTLQSELENAATTIQSNFRGYNTRQRLHRENAMQMPTTSSDTPSTISEHEQLPGMRSSGEFHDMMVLSPPVPVDANDNTSSVEEDALALCQASHPGKLLEGHVPTSVSHRTDEDVVATRSVITMGKATEVTTERLQARVRVGHNLPHRVGDMNSATNAATKIQAGFRGYKVRKQMRQGGRPEAGVKKNGPRRRRGSQNVAAQQPAKGSGKEMTLQDRSATTIQAGIRGFLVRKRRQEERDAAVKIQAGFRGYKVRRDVKTRVTEK